MANQNPKRESLLFNIGFNLVAPILILRKGDDWFGPPLAEALKTTEGSALVGSIILVVAIAFPVIYGILDLRRRKRWNMISILGAVSALLTGGIGLIPGATASMFAVKEAALPAILAIATIVTLKTEKPLVKLFLYNPDFLNVSRIESALDLRNSREAFDLLLKRCTWYIAVSFILSAGLNYILARMIVVTEPYQDKKAFNEEVGAMMTWSFPVISIPCMIVTFFAFWQLMKGIKAHAGLELEEVLLAPEKKDA